jgi:hypothetical protein
MVDGAWQQVLEKELTDITVYLSTVHINRVPISLVKGNSFTTMILHRTHVDSLTRISDRHRWILEDDTYYSTQRE